MSAMKYSVFMMVLLLTACGGHYKHPSMSGDPSKMSADTLCFRYASSKNPALAKEISARNIDCTALLHDDPLYGNSDLDAAHRITR